MNYKEYFEKANNFLLREMYEHAIVYYDKTINKNPEHAEAWNNKGFALKELGRHEEALSCFKKTLELEPNHKEAYVNKGISLGELDKTIEAIDCLKMAIKIDSTYASAWLNIATLSMKLGKLKEAEDAFEKFIRYSSEKFSPLVEQIKTTILPKIKQITKGEVTIEIPHDSIGVEKNHDILHKDYKFLSKIINGIKSKNIVIFCGAGISYNSGLPLTDTFVQYILTKLDLSENEINIIKNVKWPFEAFIETLQDACDIDILLNIFNLCKPNTNHLLFAHLAKMGFVKTICTTNFDILIEKAFDSVGLVMDKDYLVYYKEEEFNDINWKDDRIRLIKLHGTIKDRDNMSITLRNVASKLPSIQRQNVIEKIFSTGDHNSVLFMGYSFSDVFDILPQIKAIGENFKKVIYIKHPDCDEQRREGEITGLNELDDMPFNKFKGSSQIIFNTDKAVKAIWENCLTERYTSTEFLHNHVMWKTYINTWSSHKPKPLKHNITGQIFLKISEFDLAMSHFNEALNYETITGDESWKAVSLANLGLAKQGKALYSEAIEDFREALQILEKTGDKEAKGNQLHSIGLSYFLLGEYDKAKEFIEQSIDICKEILQLQKEKSQELRVKAIYGNRLANLGNTYKKFKEYSESSKYLERALNMSEEIGDLKGVECRLGNLGTLLIEQDHFEEAIKKFEQALEIAEKIGDKTSVCIHSGNMGLAYIDCKKYPKAIKLLEKSIDLAVEIGNKKVEADMRNGLGTAYRQVGRLEDSNEQYKKADQIAREINHPQTDLYDRNLNSASLKSLIINDIEFIFVRGGTFKMGDVFNEGYDDESPINIVYLTDFYMSKYAITFAQYDAFCESTNRQKPYDEGWGRNNRPVINVNWFDAVKFCEWLSEVSGKTIRLPNEIEWEYAAREGGFRVRFGNGQDIARSDHINFDARSSHKARYSEVGEYRGKTLPVGSFAPNRLGFHDMSGNVWEWCSNRYTPNYSKSIKILETSSGLRVGEFYHRDVRALRGGAFDTYPSNVRATLRGWDNGRTHNKNRGFRIVAEV